MVDFLKENWIWIVAPVLIVALIVFVILVFSKDDPGSVFVYNISN